MTQVSTPFQDGTLETAPDLIALSCKTPPPARYCQRPRWLPDLHTRQPVLLPCGRPRCSHQCRDVWAKRLAICLGRSFEDLPPTYELRVTVVGVISHRDLSSAICRFLRRLRYRLKALGSRFEYLVVNEWHDGHRHTHFLVRTSADLTRQTVRALWRMSLPQVRFTCHCAPVWDPGALDR
jgi:hypothetical protein